MTDPEYRYDLILPHHLVLLAEVAAGDVRFRNGIPALMRRGLVDDFLHHVVVNPLGLAVLAGLRQGADFVVSNNHRLPLLRNRTGRVTAVSTYANGGVRIEASMDGLPGTWCFYETRDAANGRNRAVSDGLLVPVMRTAYAGGIPKGLALGRNGADASTGYFRDQA